MMFKWTKREVVLPWLTVCKVLIINLFVIAWNRVFLRRVTWISKGTEGNHLSPTELKDGGGGGRHYRTRLQTNFQQERISLTTKRRVGKWLLFLHPPGHSFPTQSIVSLKSPSQYFPPWSGAGLVHVLFRKLVPLPHGLEHRVQSDQFENPPLTVNK